MKVDEGIVARGVLVADLGRLSQIGGADRWMAAGGAFARRIVTHVLHVGFPSELGALKLIDQRRNVCRVDATLADRLAIGGRAGTDKLLKHAAVIIGGRIGGLTANQSQVIAKAEMAGGVVIRDCRTQPSQRFQIMSRRLGSEGVAILFVLKHHNKHVVNGGYGRRPGGGAQCRAHRHA